KAQEAQEARLASYEYKKVKNKLITRIFEKPKRFPGNILLNMKLSVINGKLHYYDYDTDRKDWRWKIIGWKTTGTEISDSDVTKALNDFFDKNPDKYDELIESSHFHVRTEVERKARTLNAILGVRPTNRKYFELKEQLRQKIKSTPKEKRVSVITDDIASLFDTWINLYGDILDISTIGKKIKISEEEFNIRVDDFFDDDINDELHDGGEWWSRYYGYK
ncbi:MAG: hypothetical protein LE180_06285, partial [Endomicrobium sp.]|uniref:hypothetical protein n=1 Tax=Candidatus Endomicrobiellum pyrsonymphae TaxID=1408203 RepID=UPI00358BB5D5|nr:hypothetical protein [Endomicrobium sp.]